jgi:hypothetical protein
MFIEQGAKGPCELAHELRVENGMEQGHWNFGMVGVDSEADPIHSVGTPPPADYQGPFRRQQVFRSCGAMVARYFPVLNASW